jgi:hypothetical protein
MRAPHRIALPALAGVVLLVAAAGARAQNPTIVASWDRRGESCNADIPLFTADTLYILATPGDLDYIVGAELRITGFPMDWFGITVTPSPAAIVSIGNLLTTGSNIAFPGYETGTDGIVLLYMIAFVSTSLVDERVIGIAAHAITPTQPCPLVIWDNGLVFWARCADPRPAAIDFPSYCSVGVESASWGEIRSLYR